MNKKGFTYIEMVCVLAVITVLVVITLYFLHPKFSYAKRTTFLNQANTITKAAINKYTNDSSDADDEYPDDVYKHTDVNDPHLGKICYSLSSLKDKYLKKLGDSYQGSVEICTLTNCEYKTKLWLSNDEYYIDGVIDHIDKKDLTNKVFGINHCGNN